MTATKVGVLIHKSGSENDILTKLVANINEGRVTISQNDIIGYLNTRNAIYPSIHNFSYLMNWPDLHISEDGGKTFTLTLTFKEVEELAESTNDLQEVNI